METRKMETEDGDRENGDKHDIRGDQEAGKATYAIGI